MLFRYSSYYLVSISMVALILHNCNAEPGTVHTAPLYHSNISTYQPVNDNTNHKKNDLSAFLKPAPVQQQHNYLSQAKVLHKERQYTNALELYNKAVLQNPKNYEILLYRSDVLRNLNRTNESIADLDYVLYHDTQNDLIYALRAQAYMANQEYNKAITDLTKSLQLSQQSEYYVQRAYAYTQLNNNEQALINYQAAININPTSLDAYVSRAEYYIQLGDYNNALEDLEMARSINPNDHSIYKNLAIVQKQLGQYEESLVSIKKAQELSY